MDKNKEKTILVFDTKAIQWAATFAEAEGATKIEAIHFERILPQLLLHF